MLLSQQYISRTLLAGALFMAVGIVVGMTDSFRFVKTLFLIARVAPYEQTGTGDGLVQFLGDSTGYGTGATRGEYSVAGRLGADFPGYTIQNQSVNGRTIGGLLEDNRDFAGQYDLIVLQIGGNDILQNRPTREVLNELRELLNMLSAHTDHIVMMTSGNVGAAVAFSGQEAQGYERLTRALRQGVFAIAAERSDFTYIDLFNERADDPFAQLPEKYTALDSLHPSNAGYGLWYQKGKSVFSSILKE